MSVYHLPDRLNPYVKNGNIWRCPSFKLDWPQFPAPPGGGTGWWSTILGPISYGVNYKVMPTWTVRELASIKAPVETWIIGDSVSFDICWGRYDALAYASICGWQVTPCASPSVGWEHPDNTRHNGGSNIAYVDGHAKWMGASEILKHCAAPCGSTTDHWWGT